MIGLANNEAYLLQNLGVGTTCWRCKRAKDCQWVYLSSGYVVQHFGIALQVAAKDVVHPNGCTGSATVAELELELIQTQMAQKPMLRAEVGMRVRCANKASAE